jgi:hypothetical protein
MIIDAHVHLADTTVMRSSLYVQGHSMAEVVSAVVTTWTNLVLFPHLNWALEVARPNERTAGQTKTSVDSSSFVRPRFIRVTGRL